MKRKNKKSFNWYGLKQRFSIRKYHFGAASVLIGTTMFLMGGPTAQASEQNRVHVEATTLHDKPKVAAGLTSNEGVTQPKDKGEKVVEKTEDNKKTPVSKDELRRSLQELKFLLGEFSTEDKDKVENQERVAEKAEKLLDSQEASQEEVNTQVEFVRTSIQSLKKMKEEKSKADDLKARTNEGAVSEKTDVENEKDAHSDKESKKDTDEKATSDDNTSPTDKNQSVSSGKKESKTEKEKLEKLSKNLGQYLRLSNGITRPETKELLKGVEEVVRSVEDGLKNPKLTAPEIEELMKRGKEAEKKLALAVTREHSGKRDLDNGKKMTPDSYFRAAVNRAANGVVYDAKGNENLTDALVGYVTKEGDNSGYPPGTILYISHNDNGSSAGNNNNNLGPQPVKYLKNKVLAKVTKNSNGYHWVISYNNGKESRQNPIYYFTIPSGHSVQNMTLKENGSVVKHGGVAQVFNGEADKYLTAVGSPNDGVNGSPYYENVANTQNGIVGNRGGIYTLDDFVRNDTSVYFNRDGMSQDDIRITDKLYDKIKSSTQNIFAFRPRDFDAANTYEVEFDTKADTEAPLYYIAGMKSYEKIPSGRFMHKSYQQWYGVQERYNVTVNTNVLKTTFLKGTGIGTLDTESGLMSNAVTIEDTFDHNRQTNPGRGDVTDYHTYKSTGNFSADYFKNYHNRFSRQSSEDGVNTTADRAKGNHTLYIEARIKGQPINFRLPYKIVTQSDIYQPVAKEVTDTKNYKADLGNADTYIKSYTDVSSQIDGFKTPDENDMGTPNPGNSFYKDRISYFPRTSDKIKEQAVKQVQWVDGSSLSTGKRVIELTLDNRKTELFTVPDDIDVLPGGKISKENLEKLKEAIRKQYQKVNTNGQVVGNVPTITETTPVWVKKQVKVTYYDNENNSSTNNQDDSVDYVDVLFKNIRKEIAPTTPTVSTPTDGSVSVTPNGTTDKLVVSYRPNNQNSDTTITVKKSGTTWGTLDTLPNGVKVNSSNGIVSIAEPTVKDESTVIAKATYLNSDEASATGVAKNPDNVAPTVTLNGTTLTDNASNKTVHVFRGSSLELPLKYYDNAATGRVNISYKNDGGLPQGVWFNDNANASSNYTIKQNGKTVNSQGSYTVRGNISNTASLGERPITLKVSDSADGNVDSGNKKEVKFNVRTYDIEPNSTKVTVEKGTTLSEQDAKAAVTKVNGALDLPEGTTYEWVDTNGRNQTVTPNTAGVQNYRVKVTLPSSETGNNAAFRSSKIVNVSVNVRPEAPTITTEEKYKGTLVSTERSISGTGHPGATVKITLQDGTTVREVTVENNGKWKYNLASNEKLTQNDKDSTIKASNPISVKQVVNNIESVEKTVNVQMARAISVETPVQAGREIKVKVAHDTALFYLQVNYGTAKEYQYDVIQENGKWKITDSAKANITELTVADGANISEKILTFRIKDSNKKNNIPFIIPAGNNKVRVRAHHINNHNNPADPANDGGWATASPATNTNPDISVVNPNATYNSDGTLTKDKLKTFVNVTDAEDDNNKTVGNSARENLDVTVTKNGQSVDLSNGKALKQGTYILTYTTIDAAGERVTKNHTITVNYIAQAKPTINLIQGENLSDAVKRSLFQLKDGDEVKDVPNDATVEFTNLDINTPSDNKTAQATVVLKNGTRLSPVTLNYNVLKTFKIVEKVYDFKVNDSKKEGRNDTPPSYYTDSNGLPGGMSWVVKRNNEAEFKNADTHMINMLKADGVGKTIYAFGGKYPKGRFTNNPSETEKLYYTPTFTHEVFDVGANPTKVVANHGASLNADQAKAAVSLINNSASLPTGTTYEWVKSETDSTVLTDAEKNVTEYGEITRYVKVTLPKVSETGPNANRVQPYKIIPVTLKVNETVKPIVKLVGEDSRDIPLSEGTANESLPKVTVYRGEKANITIKASDNTSKIASLTTSALPNGVIGSGITSSDSATDKSPLIHTLSGIVAKNATVEEKIVTVTVSDKTNPVNTTIVKFKIVVKKQTEKYTPTTPTNAVNFNNLGNNIPATDANKITDQVNVTDLSKEAEKAGGVSKTLKNNGAIKTVEGKKVVTVIVTYPDQSTDEVDVPVAQNYNVVARPTINFKQGESLSDEDKRSLVQLQDGENKVEIPRNANVTFENLDTTMPEDHNKMIEKTAIATITFADKTVKKIPVNYKV